MLARMDEDVHAGVGGGELLAVERSGENRGQPGGFELRPVHAVADDDQLQVIAACQHREALDMLLWGEPADEPDDRLAAR